MIGLVGTTDDEQIDAEYKSTKGHLLGTLDGVFGAIGIPILIIAVPVALLYAGAWLVRTLL